MDSEMMCCDTQVRKLLLGKDDNGDSSSSSASSTITSDSCPSPPPKKRPHIDYTLPEESEDEALYSDSEVELFNEPNVEYSPSTVVYRPPSDYLYRFPTDEEFSKQALLFLKDNQGIDYEFLEVRSKFVVQSKAFIHINFWARPKGSEASHLLFAEVNNKVKVVACSVVSYDADFFSLDVTIHPHGVVCLECEDFNQRGRDCFDREAGSDEE